MAKVQMITRSMQSSVGDRISWDAESREMKIVPDAVPNERCSHDTHRTQQFGPREAIESEGRVNVDTTGT
jgi:hypothetical protein